MILVDTNVVSEPMRARGDPRVSSWLDRQARATQFISTVTIAEVLYGIASLNAGKRRAALVEAFDFEIMRLFEGRILSFDLAAARSYASILSAARAKGLAISVADGQIAAIAAANGFSVATRDEAPRAAGVGTVNPWTE